jgi:hypothetical protein
MSHPITDTISPNDFRVPGTYYINDNGYGQITVTGNSTQTFTAKFHIPKTTDASRGYRLDGFLLNYKVSSGALTNVTSSLQSVVVDTSGSPVAPVVSTVPLDLPVSFTPAAAGTYNTNAYVITTPAFDNTANAVTRYVITVTFTNAVSTTAVLEFDAITIQYTQNLAA